MPVCGPFIGSFEAPEPMPDPDVKKKKKNHKDRIAILCPPVARHSLPYNVLSIGCQGYFLSVPVLCLMILSLDVLYSFSVMMPLS